MKKGEVLVNGEEVKDSAVKLILKLMLLRLKEKY